MSPERSTSTSSFPSPWDNFSQSLGWSAAWSFWVPTIFLFSPSVGTNQWILFWKHAWWGTFLQNCRLLSTCVSSKATASGGGAGLSSPKLDTTDPVLSNNHHCSFLSKYCSLLLYIYPCLISKWHLTLCDLMDWSPLGSSFHEILRQEYRSGLPFPPPGDFPDLGVKPASFTSPTLTGRFFTCTPLEGHVTLYSAKSLPLPDSLMALLVKYPPAMQDTWARSPGVGNGYPFQYSGLENSTECMVHAGHKNWTRLSDFHFTSLRQLPHSRWTLLNCIAELFSGAGQDRTYSILKWSDWLVPSLTWHLVGTLHHFVKLPNVTYSLFLPQHLQGSHHVS